MHELATLAALYLETQNKGTQSQTKRAEAELRTLLCRLGYLRQHGPD